MPIPTEPRCIRAAKSSSGPAGSQVKDRPHGSFEWDQPPNRPKAKGTGRSAAKYGKKHSNNGFWSLGVASLPCLDAPKHHDTRWKYLSDPSINRAIEPKPLKHTKTLLNPSCCNGRGPKGLKSAPGASDALQRDELWTLKAWKAKCGK